MVIKSVIASVLMVASVSAMASPRTCLFNWAKSQGADISKKASHVDKWGKEGQFRWSNLVGTISYHIALSPGTKTNIDEAAKGPWDCHCTVNKVSYKNGYSESIGLCGKY